MKEQILDALRESRAGYREVRLRRVWSSAILVRGRTVTSTTASGDTGGLARCCSPGTGWGAVGFSGTAHLEGHLLQAHELALASASRQPVRLAPIPIRQVDGEGLPAHDPREDHLDGRRELALRLGNILLDADRRVTSSRILLRDEVVETWLGTSEGTWIHEVRATASIGVLAVASQEGSTERVLGSLTGEGWGVKGEGWGEGEGEDLVRGIAARAVERVQAVPVKPGRYPVILDPSVAGALLHRAVAHIARPALPGTDPDVLPVGTRIGPELLTVSDDPTAPGLPAGFRYDDEGTLAHRCTIVQNGVVLGHLHSRETAGSSVPAQAPTGHARAGSLRGLPFPRATNTVLAPGNGSLQDLLDGIRIGLLLQDAMACETTDAGLTLRPGAGRMIRNGQLAEPVKGVQLSGQLLPLLGCIEAIGGDFAWTRGSTHCRDGAAGVVPVSTGAPHVRLGDLSIACEVA